jgi:hypothetical protein
MEDEKRPKEEFDEYYNWGKGDLVVLTPEELKKRIDK